MNIEITGVTKFAQQLQAITNNEPEAMVAALFAEAEQIMTVSKQDYVPVDTGALRASGTVEPPVFTPTGGSVTLGFGGASAPYAVIVHEDLTKVHPIGQAKYLETPLRLSLQGMTEAVYLKANEAIKEGKSGAS